MAGKSRERDPDNGCPRVGQAVTLTCRPLAGLTGLVVGLRDDGRCQIRLDIAQRGVYLVIEAGALRSRLPAAEAEYRHERRA